MYIEIEADVNNNGSTYEDPGKEDNRRKVNTYIKFWIFNC